MMSSSLSLSCKCNNSWSSIPGSTKYIPDKLLFYFVLPSLTSSMTSSCIGLSWMLVCVHLFQRTRPFSKVVWSPAEIVRDIQAILLCVIVGVFQNWFEHQLKTKMVIWNKKRGRWEEDIHLCMQGIWRLNINGKMQLQPIFHNFTNDGSYHANTTNSLDWILCKTTKPDMKRRAEYPSRLFRPTVFTLGILWFWNLYLLRRWVLLKLKWIWSLRPS